MDKDLRTIVNDGYEDAFVRSIPTLIKGKNADVFLDRNYLIYTFRDGERGNLENKIQLGPLAKEAVERLIKDHTGSDLSMSTNFGGQLTVTSKGKDILTVQGSYRTNEFEVQTRNSLSGYEPATGIETFSIKFDTNDENKVIEKKLAKSFVHFNKLPNDKIVKYLNEQNKAPESLKVFVKKFLEGELKPEDFPVSDWQNQHGKTIVPEYQNFFKNSSSKDYQLGFHVSESGEMEFYALNEKEGSTLRMRVGGDSGDKLIVR